MDILSQMFEFGTKLKYKKEDYIGISSVGYNTDQKISFWLAIKDDSKDFPLKVYLIPKETK